MKALPLVLRRVAIADAFVEVVIWQVPAPLRLRLIHSSTGLHTSFTINVCCAMTTDEETAIIGTREQSKRICLAARALIWRQRGHNQVTKWTLGANRA